MLRSVLARLPFVSGGESTEDDADEEAEDAGSTFLPSRLDASVLASHGAEVEQRLEPTDDDITELEEEARRLDRERQFD